MTRTIQLRRLLLLGFLLALAFAGLGYRLVELQVFQHERLADIARDNTRRSILREPARGDIRDARGNPLATSVFVKTVCADPWLIGSRHAEVARALAPLLEVEPGELTRLLTRYWRTNSAGQVVSNRYVVLQRKVTQERWAQVTNAMARLDFGVDERQLPRTVRANYRLLRTRGVFAGPVEDQLRVYPNRSLAAHVLGFVNTEYRTLKGVEVGENSGMSGIEYSLNRDLTGVRGWRRTEADHRGRELVTFRDQDVEPRPGRNVILTLDMRLQQIAEAELAVGVRDHTPRSATAIILRPQTGEVLALATLPNFDPNRPGVGPPENLRHRAIADFYEPGSTFKIVVVAGALNDGLVRLDDVFDCENGAWVHGGLTLRDHARYGKLTVEQIITKSSNIGAAKIGLLLGEQRLWEHIRNFGFGQVTGIPLVSETTGLVHPVSRWLKSSITRIPMGHEVATSPLQMAVAMAAIANGGRLMRPMLVDRLEDHEGRVVAKYQPQFVRQVVSEDAARKMVAALKTVVGTNGTGLKAALDHYTVAGKTGTAQKPSATRRGYEEGKYYASFIGFFPADQPELCIAVAMDEPKNGHYGGDVAAPVFKRIAEQAANYLNIRPDREVAAPPGVLGPPAAGAAPLTAARSGQSLE
jgi:cell division protein FtsI/penicillin-binding protein 2